jgi:hypothetical protein
MNIHTGKVPDIPGPGAYRVQEKYDFGNISKAGAWSIAKGPKHSVHKPANSVVGTSVESTIDVNKLLSKVKVNAVAYSTSTSPTHRATYNVPEASVHLHPPSRLSPSSSRKISREHSPKIDADHSLHSNQNCENGNSLDFSRVNSNHFNNDNEPEISKNCSLGQEKVESERLLGRRQANSKQLRFHDSDSNSDFKCVLASQVIKSPHKLKNLSKDSQQQSKHATQSRQPWISQHQISKLAGKKTGICKFDNVSTAFDMPQVHSSVLEEDESEPWDESEDDRDDVRACKSNESTNDMGEWLIQLTNRISQTGISSVPKTAAMTESSSVLSSDIDILSQSINFMKNGINFNLHNENSPAVSVVVRYCIDTLSRSPALKFVSLKQHGAANETVQVLLLHNLTDVFVGKQTSLMRSLAYLNPQCIVSLFDQSNGRIIDLECADKTSLKTWLGHLNIILQHSGTEVIQNVLRNDIVSQTDVASRRDSAYQNYAPKNVPHGKIQNSKSNPKQLVGLNQTDISDVFIESNDIGARKLSSPERVSPPKWRSEQQNLVEAGNFP